MQPGTEVALQDDKAQLYAFPGKTEFEAYDTVVTSATLVCAWMAIVFFDLGCTYSYGSFQLPWDLMWFVIYLVPSSMFLP